MSRARGAVAAGLLLALAGCAQQYQENWDKLHAGMTHEEVEALLGKPSSTFVPKPTKEDPKAAARASERWQYGDTLSSLGTRALFPEEADERTWCVFFGPDGKVTSFERPYRGTGNPPALDR